MARIAPTADEFLVVYRQFSGEPYSDLVQDQLDLSARLLSVDAWEDFYSNAVALDAAHNLTMLKIASKNGLDGAQGPISSVSAGGISTSFSTVAPDGKLGSRDWYMKTTFGQQFLRLRNAVIAPGCMA
jgi:hypothetical protein